MEKTPEQAKGAHGVLETMNVTINGEDAVINAEDFDPKVHEKVEGEPKSAKKKAGK